MKKQILALISISLFLFSCGGGSESTSENTNEAEATEQSADQTNAEDIKTCDDFLDNFESWGDDYIDVVEAFMKDPTSAEAQKKYTESSQKAATWLQEWSKHVVCAQSEKYQKRFDEITERLDKRMEELGFE